MGIKNFFMLYICVLTLAFSSYNVSSAPQPLSPITVDGASPVRVQIFFVIPQDKKHTVSPADIPHTFGGDERSFWFYTTKFPVKFTLDLTLTYRAKVNQTITYSAFGADRRITEGGIEVFRDIVIIRFVVNTYEKEHYPTSLEVSRDVSAGVVGALEANKKALDDMVKTINSMLSNMIILTLLAVALSLIAVGVVFTARSRIMTIEAQSQYFSQIYPAIFGKDSVLSKMQTELQRINQKLEKKEV